MKNVSFSSPIFSLLAKNFSSFFTVKLGHFIANNNNNVTILKLNREICENEEKQSLVGLAPELGYSQV